MTVRRFAEGDRFRVGGVEFKVERGRKAPDDLRIDWLTHDEWVGAAKWRAVPMDAVFLLCDFLYENEDVLYPPSEGYMGGDKFIGAVHDAVREGWTHSARGLAIERLMVGRTIR